MNRIAADSTMRVGSIVGAPAQAVAGEPERRGRHAIAVQQPVEDRRGADVAADDARLPADAQQHQHAERGGDRAQQRQRPLLGDPHDARHHQREGDGEPALFEREGERERERRDRAGRKQRARGRRGPAAARAL